MTVKDCTSVKEYWQLKKEIRGSKDHLIVGIDVAKDDRKAFFGTAYGKTLLKRLTFKDVRYQTPHINHLTKYPIWDTCVTC